MTATGGNRAAGASHALAALAGLAARVWLVGGAVRDRLLERPTLDYDVVLDGDPRRVARELGRLASGHAFELSEAFAAWRVVGRDGDWQVDLLRLAGDSIEDDLANRDLTINAMAQPLAAGELVDPFDGRADLREQRLRAVSAQAFERDRLRVLRLVRLACELGFSIESDTAGLAQAAVGGLADVAPERVFEELKRVLCSNRVVQGIDLMDRLGVLGAILPELVALRDVEQSSYHHLDVRGHTLAVLAEMVRIEEDPVSILGSQAQAVNERLRMPLANGLNRWGALRFGALLHDVAKPQTRAVTAEGRVTFLGHDRLGAEMAAGIMERLRSAERLREHVAALVRHHLRLGFLVHRAPLSRRAVYDYLHACQPVGLDVTVLSIADRLATRGRRAEVAIAEHLHVARAMLEDALRWEAAPPRPPLRGDELARELGLTPGPEIGRILAELRRAAFAAEITTREQALERAWTLLAPDG